MSVVLTVIAKSQETKSLKVSSVVCDYLMAEEQTYIQPERNGLLFIEGGGVLGFAFEDKTGSFQTPNNWYAKKLSICGRNIVLAKRIRHNTNESYDEIKKEVAENFNLESSFVALEQTGYLAQPENIDKAHPAETLGGKVYLTVGMVTAYFTEGTQHNNYYKDDNRGLEFAAKFKDAPYDLVSTSYYSEFLDNNRLEDFTKKEFTGLTHFTTVIYELNGKLTISFLQSEKMSSTKYFFEPDTVFCSDSGILRNFRNIEYPNSTIDTSHKLAISSYGI